MSKVILTEISTETAAQLVELPTDLNEVLQQIFLTPRTLVKGSSAQSKGLAHTLIEWAARQTPPAPCCLINLANVDEFERLTVDVSVVEDKLSIQPGILARTLEAENGILLIYNAQLNSEGINDIFDGSFWQLHNTQLCIAKGLKIIGIAPIESKLALKTYKISPAQSGRYLQSRVLPPSLEFKQSASLSEELPASDAKNAITIDCGFRRVETLEAYLLGTPPLQKNGKREFIPGILTTKLRSSPAKIVFLNVLQADIAVSCFFLKAPLGQSLLNAGESSDLKGTEFYVDNSPPKIRKKIISLKAKACRGLTNIVWITSFTAPALFRSILKIEEDQSYFLYEDSTGVIDKVGDPAAINWVISGNLIAEDFYPLLILPNLYVLDNVLVPSELKAHVDRQAGTIEDTKISTPIAEPWLKVIIHEDKNRQAVLSKLTDENKEAQIIYVSGHDTRLIEPLWQALAAKQQVILTDLAKNPDLLEALQNFFSGAAGYRNLQGEWLLPATTGGEVILLVSPEEYSKQLWLQELAQQELPLSPSSIPETPISSGGLKNFELLSAMLNQGKRFIFCKGADPWQQDNAIFWLKEKMQALVQTYKLGPSTDFADFENIFMEWAKDLKSDTPKIFAFTGEMSSPALLFLQGLFAPSTIVLPNSQRISLSAQHSVIFFQDIGMKKSQALLETLATPVIFTPLTFGEMETLFLQPFMEEEKLDTHTLTPLLRLLNDWLARWQINLSIGDYSAIIGLVAAYDSPWAKAKEEDKTVKTTPIIVKWAAATRLAVSPHLKPDMQLAFNCWLLMLSGFETDEPYYEIATNRLLQCDKTIVDTPQTRHGLNIIFQYLQSYLYFAGKEQRMPGKTALAVVGETMAGKSFLVLKAVQFVVLETSYRIVNGGPYAQLHHDMSKLTVCSELNLVAAELLNQIDHMPLIGTLNPPGERYESRQKLPPALAARMFQLNLATPPVADLLNIHKIAAEYHAPLLEFHTYAAGYASTRSLINAGQLQQGRFELASCFQAYGYALWDTDERKAGHSLIAAPQTGCRKTFFYFFEGLEERELYITFSTEAVDQLRVRTKEISLPFPPAELTERDYFFPLSRLLYYSIVYWVISASDAPVNDDLCRLLADEILNKYYPALYHYFFKEDNRKLGEILYSHDFSHKATQWIETTEEIKGLNDQYKRSYLFMLLLQAFKTDKTIDWSEIADQLGITNYFLLMNFFDIQALDGSDKATIKNYILRQKIPLMKEVIERFTLTEEIKEIKTERNCIGSPDRCSGAIGAPRQYRTLAQISPPKQYYFPTNHYSLDETGLPITSGQYFQVPEGIPEECSLRSELDGYSRGDPVTIKLLYSELADADKMLLPMPAFHGLAELPDHFECYYQDGNHYIRKAPHQNDAEQCQPFSYKVVPYDVLPDFKLQGSRQSVPALDVQESRLPPKIRPSLSALKSALIAKDVQLALTNLRDSLNNYLQYIPDDAEDNEAREFRFNFQAAYVGDQGQIDLLKMLYFCLDTRKVVCVESMLIFLILARYALGNAVKFHALSGLTSDDTGKLTDESHTWIMINGIVFDVMPPKLLRQKAVQPHPDSSPATEEKTSDEKQLRQPKPQLAPKPELKSELQPAPKPQPDTESKTESEPSESQPASTPKAETESKTESEPDPALKSESQPASTPKAETESKTESEPDPALKSEPQPASTPKAETESKTESQPTVKPKSEREFTLFSRRESKNNDKKAEVSDHPLDAIKDRDLIVLRLEPLFKFLGGQSPQAGGVIHTHFSMSQNINHRRDASGLPAFIKKSFPISFTPITLISLSFSTHERAHFLLQCLLEKGFKLVVPGQHNIVEVSNADDFMAKTRELNSADEKEIERFKESSDSLCREMRSDDWSEIFKLFDEILPSIPSPKKPPPLPPERLALQNDDVNFFSEKYFKKNDIARLKNLALGKYSNSRACLEYFSAEFARLERLELPRSSSIGGIFKPTMNITLPKFIILNHEIKVEKTIKVLCLGWSGKEQEISQFITNFMKNGEITSSNSLHTSKFERGLGGKNFIVDRCLATSITEVKNAAPGQSIILAFDEASDYLPKRPKIIGYVPKIIESSIRLHRVAHKDWDAATASKPIQEISTKAFEFSRILLIQSLQLIINPEPTPEPTPAPPPEQNSQCLLQ